MKIKDLQEKVINHIKKKFDYFKQENIDTAVSSLSFIGTWGDNLGFENLKLNCLKTSNKFKFIILYIKDLYSAIKYSDIEYSSNFEINGQSSLIISTASGNDFSAEGFYKDRYLKIKSRDYKEFIFLILFGERKFPNNIDKNIVLFKKKKNFLKGIFNFLNFLKLLILNPLLFKKKIHHFSDQTNFAQEIAGSITKIINFERIKTVLSPFEGIPYQQKIFENIKKINNDITTIGYDHSAPHAMPLNMYHRNGSPDFLVVNGSSQVHHLENFLNWPKSKLIEFPSLRYEENSKEDFNNIVFLPWKIFNPQKILRDFELFIKNSPDGSLYPLKVKTHPVCVNVSSQEKIKDNIIKIINDNNEKFSENIKNNSISIFIGSTTGVIVALEKGLKILHICFDPIFDSYSEFLWPNLNVEKITENTFIYSLKKSGSFIKFGQGKKTFDDYYRNFKK